MEQLDNKIRTGLAWSGVTKGAEQLVYLVTSVILTRLLTPEDFGLVGMIIVFTGFALILTDLGFSAALVQRLDVGQHHKNAVFWVSLAAGALITLVVAAAAPLIASFYAEPALQPLTVGISLVFFINAFGTVNVALLQKAMDFRKLSAARLTSVVLSGGIAIYLALSGFGVWSLVAMYVLYSLVYVVALWAVAPWRPNLSLRWDALKDLTKYSSNLLGYTAFTYWTRNGDNLLIGRYVGAAPLGIYSRCYNILLLPVASLAGAVTSVMFPALSVIQKDRERVNDMYLKSISVISLVTFPLMLGLLVVSPSFVLALFGDKWAGMIPILQVFSILGAIQSLTVTTEWIYQSQGRTDIMFRWGLVTGSASIVSFIVGLRWGAMGVAVAYTLANLLLWYPSWSIPARLIGLNFVTMLRRLAPTFCSAATMALVVWALGLVLPNSWSAATHLVLQASLGAVVYGILARSFRLDAYVIASKLVSLYFEDLRAR